MVLLEVKLFRQCMYIPRGIQNKLTFIAKCKVLADKYDDMKSDDDKKNHIIKLYTFYANNNYWFIKVYNNKKKDKDYYSYRRFIKVIKKKIKEFSYDYYFYQQLIKIFPIRYCKYCLLWTDNDQQLCNYHIKFIVYMKKKIPLELIKYIFEFIGITRKSDYI